MVFHAAFPPARSRRALDRDRVLFGLELQRLQRLVDTVIVISNDEFAHIDLVTAVA